MKSLRTARLVLRPTDSGDAARAFEFEAARKVVHFAFGDAGLSRIMAGHASDNPASARILVKLGFCPIDQARRFSRPRGEAIVQHRYALLSSST